jgi:hypothetical protein
VQTVQRSTGVVVHFRVCSYHYDFYHYLYM